MRQPTLALVKMLNITRKMTINGKTDTMDPAPDESRDSPSDSPQCRGVEKRQCTTKPVHDMHILHDEVIGRGAYGNVYKIDGRPEICVKVCDAEDSESELSTRRELAVLAQVRHPHIVRMHSCQYIHLKGYIVIDRYDRDLGCLLRTRCMTADIANTCRVHLLRALRHLHARGVVHRDVKPGNILYCATTNTFCLCDFGLARVARDRAPFAELHKSWTSGKPYDNLTCAVVTRYYRAPELYISRGTYSDAIDVWSAACVIFEAELGYQSRLPRPLFTAGPEGGPTYTAHFTAAELMQQTHTAMVRVAEKGMIRAMASRGVFCSDPPAGHPDVEIFRPMIQVALDGLTLTPDPLATQLERLLPHSSSDTRALICNGLCPWPGVRPSAAELLSEPEPEGVKPMLSDRTVMLQHGLEFTSDLFNFLNRPSTLSADKK